MELGRPLKSLIALIGTATLLILVITQGIADTPTMKETPLNENGLVYEMYRAGNGELWISDWLAGEIWRVNPTSNIYTVYEGLLGASDGRLDGNGGLWWSNLDDNQLGHLVPGQSTGTLWPLPVGSEPIGLAFDAGGNVWVAASNDSFVYRFAPGTNQLCSFALPDEGTADYVLFHDGRIWLGDWVASRIVRLNPATGAVTYWQLPDNSIPAGLAFDASGHLWWAGNGLGDLGRLNPGTNAVTIYPIPGDNPLPVQVSVQNDNVWYTDEMGTVGSLDPVVAKGNSQVVTPATNTVQPTCASISSSPVAITTRSGAVVWTAANYNLAQNSDGWMIYDLPPGAAPYGLATSSDTVWFADQGEDTGLVRTQQLGSFGIEVEITDYPIFLPALLRSS